MKIFITGANGQLAKTIAEFSHSHEFLFASRSELDVLDYPAAEQKISAFHPDIVFHFASMTRGDESAQNPEKAFDINVQGTENIAKIAQKLGSEILFVSTNEVFNGQKNEPYTEEDETDPITVIGKTKREAEKVIEKYTDKFYIVRTSWLYSRWSANFIHAVLKKAREDKKIKLVKDEVGSPTYTFDLAGGLLKLIQTKQYGFYHMANRGSVSRLEFAKKAFEISGIHDVEIIPVRLNEFSRISKPPVFSTLKSAKIENLRIEMPEWDDALYRFLTAYPA